MFIGVDGSGKSTLAQTVRQKLAADGRVVSHFKTHSGRSGLERLSQELHYDSLDSCFGADTALLMMGAITWQSIRETKSARRDAERIVIHDRYTHCLLALAKLHTPVTEFKLLDLFSGLPRPDLIFFVSVDAEVATQRLIARGGGQKEPSFLRAFDSAYRALDDASHFIEIDGNQTPDAMANQTLQIFCSHLKLRTHASTAAV